MTWYNSALNVLTISLQFVWNHFVYWISIFFILPFTHVEILWILIPIWITLIFTDFFQEKHGTQLGNAITNGAVMLWVGIDWIRFILRTTKSEEFFTSSNIAKFAVCLFLIIISFIIIIGGIKRKNIIKYLGRVRATSYLMLVFSPVIYNIADISLYYILVCLGFFPLFYFVFEIVDKFIPSPIEEKDEKNTTDEKEKEKIESLEDNLSNDIEKSNDDGDNLKNLFEDKINQGLPQEEFNEPSDEIIKQPVNPVGLKYNYKSQGGDGQYVQDDDFF